MTTPLPRPPRSANLLLRLTHHGERRAEVEADLAELFLERAATKGLGHARRRYWLDVLSLWKHPLRQARNATGLLPRMPRGVAKDIVFAARLFRRQPAIVGMTVAGLAAAIGVTTAVLTLVNAVAFRGSGITDPTSVFLVEVGSGGAAPWSYPDFLQLQRSARSSRVMASAWSAAGGEFRTRGDVDRGDLPGIKVEPVSGNFFPVLGPRAAAGRLLTEADDQPAAPALLVLSFAFWQTTFSADPLVVGRTVWISDRPFVIVGVADRGFDPPGDGSAPPSGWMTMATHRQSIREAREVELRRARAEIQSLTARRDLSDIDHARLNTLRSETSNPRPAMDHNRLFVRAEPGVTRAQAEAELTTIATTLAAEIARKPGESAPIVTLRPVSELSDDDQWVIALVTAPGVLLLVVACANVTNLLLASAAGRRREIGTRLALGASRGRIVRQMLTESALLGCVSGVAGLLIATWLAPWLAVVLSLPSTIDPSPDLVVYSCAAAMTILVAVIAGLAPARYSQRGDLVSALKSDRLGTPKSVGAGRLRSTLIGCQAAASIVLLALATLFLRSLVVAAGYDHGADIGRLVNVTLRFDRGSDQSTRRAYMGAAEERVRRVSGVTSVARAIFPPFFRGGAFDSLANPSPTLRRVFRNSTSADYFSAIGARVLRGRTFTEAEVRTSAPVAVITARLAREFWGTDNPIGSTLERLWGRDDPVGARPSDWVRRPAGTRVVGVVAETTVGLRDLGLPTIYLPVPAEFDSSERLVIRAGSDREAETVVGALHATLKEIDPKVSRYVERAWDAYQSELETPRTLALLGAVVGSSALVLAVVGVFGVTSFAVVQRRHEVSVRLALGATSRQIVRMLLGDGLKPVLIGLACGLVLLFIVERFIRGLLIGITPNDPFAVGAAIALLLLAAATAAFAPARQAARVDPAGMLKEG